jgi:hypothetical protein
MIFHINFFLAQVAGNLLSSACIQEWKETRRQLGRRIQSGKQRTGKRLTALPVSSRRIQSGKQRTGKQFKALPVSMRRIQSGKQRTGKQLTALPVPVSSRRIQSDKHRTGSKC